MNKRVQISAARPGAKEFYEAQEASSRGHQPLVRTHPETGRAGALRLAALHDQDRRHGRSEVRPLLDELFAIIAEERFNYRHNWRDHDLVMWDNRCLTHRATGGYVLPDIRRMHRTTIKGTDRPAYVA